MLKIKYVIYLYFIINIKLLLGGINLIEGIDAIKLIDNPDVVFISGDSHSLYESNHITGSREMYAHHIHESNGEGFMECAPMFMCISRAEQYLRRKGIRNNQLVIAYDNFKGPNASGVYAFFESIGHKNLKLLNGGYAAIKKVDPKQIEFNALKKQRKLLKREARKENKNGNIEKSNKLKAEAKNLKKKMKSLKPHLLIVKGKEKKHKESDYTIDKFALNIQFVADKYEVEYAMHDILEKRENSKYVIIDTRSLIEIIGERKMDNVARGGHIPGAIPIEWKNITDFKNKKSFKDKASMQRVFDKMHITKDQTIYTYCQVGVGRGSHIAAALRILGYKNVKVFSGSWDVWGNDMSLPITR